MAVVFLGSRGGNPPSDPLPDTLSTALYPSSKDGAGWGLRRCTAHGRWMPGGDECGAGCWTEWARDGWVEDEDGEPAGMPADF